MTETRSASFQSLFQVERALGKGGGGMAFGQRSALLGGCGDYPAKWTRMGAGRADYAGTGRLAPTEAAVLEPIRTGPSESLLPRLGSPCGSRHVPLCLSAMKVSLRRSQELGKHRLTQWDDSEPERGVTRGTETRANPKAG